jgi:Putative peptidoglycan binding domain/Penicillin-insensitive murein endopeptidase
VPVSPSLRLLVGLALVAGSLWTAPPTVAHPSAEWPMLARKDRGADVRALEYLLRSRGEKLAVDGVFEGETNQAVRRFQKRKGLAVDGVVGPKTWKKLVRVLERSDKGPAVRALQSELIAKRRAELVVNGKFGARTRKETKRFQKHMGIGVDGVAGPVTWRNLLWHFQRHSSSRTTCRYSDHGRWGTAGAIRFLRGAGTAFDKANRGKVAVGHISKEHGGPFSPHASHRVGLDADLRPIRKQKNQCQMGTTWGSSAYARAGTRMLIQAIRKAAPQRVKVIWFNDPVLIQKGYTEYMSGHDDHLHVRYCTVANPDINYRC